MPYWTQPYDDAVFVPIEELAACRARLGQLCGDTNGASFVMSVETTLAHWAQHGTDLDAYILPQPSGWHDGGIRYGDEPHQYLGPDFDKEKLTALLIRYSNSFEADPSELERSDGSCGM